MFPGSLQGPPPGLLRSCSCDLMSCSLPGKPGALDVSCLGTAGRAPSHSTLARAAARDLGTLLQMCFWVANPGLMCKLLLLAVIEGWVAQVGSVDTGQAGLASWLKIHQDLECRAILYPCLFHQPGAETCCQLNLDKAGLKWAFSTVAGQLHLSLVWDGVVISWPEVELGTGPEAPCEVVSGVH